MNAPSQAGAGDPGRVPVDPPPADLPPQQQIAQAKDELAALTKPAFVGGTPEGATVSTPVQAAADALNSDERLKGVALAEGDVNAAAEASKAEIYDRKAAASAQLASDQQLGTTESLAEMNQIYAGHMAAYDKYRASAGTLKDPETQFYEDKGQGYRIQTSLAAFAAGIGSASHGSSDNPVLDLLQKKIQANYESHKQNIEDLYRSSVEAGKIADSAENRAKFKQDAFRTSADLQNAHFKDELEYVGARSSSPLAKLAVQKTIEQINKGEIETRLKLAQQRGAASAAGLAAARARTSEIRSNVLKLREQSKDLTPEAQTEAIATGLQSLGYNRSEVAPFMQGLGVQTDPKTGEYVIPKAAAETGPSEPAVVDGKLVIPSRDPNTGKPYSPEVTQKMSEDARKRSLRSDGRLTGLAPTEEAAKAQNEGAANIRALDSFEPDKVVEGTALGGGAAHLPTFIPGVEAARKNVSAREAYNDQVRVSIGAAYKSGTGANEPKNMELIKTYAEPFEVRPSDTAEIVKQKRENLKKFIRQNTGLGEPVAAATPADLVKAAGGYKLAGAGRRGGT